MRDNRNSVTVVIPVYNRAHLFLDSLESVVGQTHLPDQVVVVDDGSTDGIAEVFTEWMKVRRSTCPVQLVRQTNKGVAAARNVGLELSPTARWYAFLDSDDTWPSDFLARCKDAFSHTPNAIAATCDRKEVWTDSMKVSLSDMSLLTSDPVLWMFRYGSALLSGTVLCGEAVRRLGGFSSDRELQASEDLMLLLQLSQKGEWLHVPGAPYVYRHHGKGVDSDQLHLKFSNNRHRWANAYDDFYFRFSESFGERDKLFRKLLSKRWREAGNEHLRFDRPEMALEAYRRGVSLYPDFWIRFGYARARLRITRFGPEATGPRDFRRK
jgi:glycosyltransferase involved in cell wall biosynthesis